MRVEACLGEPRVEYLQQVRWCALPGVRRPGVAHAHHGVARRPVAAGAVTGLAGRLLVRVGLVPAIAGRVAVLSRAGRRPSGRLADRRYPARRPFDVDDRQQFCRGSAGPEVAPRPAPARSRVRVRSRIGPKLPESHGTVGPICAADSRPVGGRKVSVSEGGRRAVPVADHTSPCEPRPCARTQTGERPEVAAGVRLSGGTIPDNRASPRQRVAAYGLALDRGRVLLVRASALPNVPSTWFLPGGGIEFGEAPDVALQREVTGETGYACDVGPRPDGSPRRRRDRVNPESERRRADTNCAACG